MTREKIDEMLKNYRFEVGRCGHLETEISQLQSAIQHSMAILAEEISAVKPQQLSDMPHGTAIGNPTENMAVMLASGWVPDYVKEMQNNLAELKAEYNSRYLSVLFVSSWLKGLSERERWIVERQIIDGEYWKDIIVKYKAAFAEDTSKDSLKRLKRRALDKIYLIAE